MSYSYLEDVAIADIAFVARGRSIEELFAAAVDATTNVMVEELAAVRDLERITLRLENDSLDLLLFDLLNELVYLKDVRGLLLRSRTIRFGKKGPSFALEAELYGEQLDPERHPLRADVKAVTLHRFGVRQIGNEWEATVVLDI